MSVSNVLVYIKKFQPKESSLPEIKEGKVYIVEYDGECFSFHNPGSPEISLFVHKTSQSGPRWDAEIIQITEKNYHQFKYTSEEDAKLIHETFIKPIIEKSNQEFDEQQKRMMDGLGANVADLTAMDNNIVHALYDVVSHIRGTFSDKYESEEFPAVDMYGLMRTSPHGAGFNIGNASKYLKRYLTLGYEKSGKIEDLYKATHYILFEISRRKFGC